MMIKTQPLFAKLLIYALSLYSACTLISMAPMNVSFFLLFLIFLIVFFRSRSKINFQQNVSYLLYLRYGSFLFFACLLSLLVAKIHPVLYAGHAPEITIHGFLKIWYLLCPGIILASFVYAQGTFLEFKLILNFWWLMTLVMGFVAVIQFNTGWPLAQIIPTNIGYYHVILFFGHHLSTASILIFPAFTALCIAVGTYSRTRIFKPFETWVGLVGLLILFLSYARTAWLAIPIGIAFILIRYLDRKLFLRGFIALSLGLALASQTAFMKERIGQMFGVSERVQLWKANIDFFTRNPVTGIGWLKTQEMSEFYFRETDPQHYREHFWGHAHSNIFEMLGGTGMIGLLAFFAWSFFTLQLAYQASQTAKKQGEYELSDLAWGLLIALFLLHINGLTNVTFWEGKVMHSQMLAVGFLLIIKQLLLHRQK